MIYISIMKLVIWVFLKRKMTFAFILFIYSVELKLKIVSCDDFYTNNVQWNYLQHGEQRKNVSQGDLTLFVIF